MKNHQKIPILLALTTLSCIFIDPAQAQPRQPVCLNDKQEQPNQDRREITNAEYGLRFEIPANYRTELRRETDLPQRLYISVINPADIVFLDCARRNRIYGAGHQVSDVVIRIEPRPSNIRSVRDVLQNASGRADSGFITISDSGFITIAGQDAVTYTMQSLYPERYRYVVLIHPNGQDLVSIFTGDYGEEIDPMDLDVMDMVVYSLEIDN